jgi:argininosuccinate lyase
VSADSPASGEVPPPEGYLGADARITSGPAPELVEAGYALETADAPLLHRGLTIADLAHLAELVEAGVVRREDAAPMLAALLKLLEVPAGEFSYDPVYGDAYNSRERVLEQQIGADAGWVHLGRTRREAGRIAFRLALRDLLLDLHADVAAFATAAADQAAGHAGTIWADTTYLQPAQPSTFGHYLGSFAEQALRHLDRIQAAYQRADVSPGGAGGAGGTRLPVDRDRLARRLGFAATGAHTRDVMWAADALSDALLAASLVGAELAQLAADLEIFASPAFGYVRLPASLCRASVLMPQKRNPYALPVLRGGAGTLIGRPGSAPPCWPVWRWTPPCWPARRRGTSPRPPTWPRISRSGPGWITAPRTGWSAGPSRWPATARPPQALRQAGAQTRARAREQARAGSARA